MVIRDDFICGTVEEIKGFLRGDLRISTEERTNSSEV